MTQKSSRALWLGAMLLHVAIELDRQHVVAGQKDLMHPIARTERLVTAAGFLGHLFAGKRPHLDGGKRTVIPRLRQWPALAVHIE